VVFATPALPTRAAGSKVSAGTYAADITTPINNLAAVPVFKGYQSAAQSIANNSITALGMDTEAVDSESAHSTSVNTSRYVAPVAGWYLVIAYVAFAANGTGNRLVEIRVNGAGAATNLAQTVNQTPGAANGSALSAASLILLQAGDYVEAYGYQTSGGALNTSPAQTGMQVAWIRG
jgi:hypothetical protein